jgi:hypothetical protein
MVYPAGTGSNDTGLPRVEVFNSKQTVAWSGVAVAANLQIGVKAPINVVTAKTFLIASRSILSFCIVKDQFSGALGVELSPDGGFTFFESFTFPLSGEGILDSLSDFPLCASAARFTLMLGSVGYITSGWLELRSF